MHLVRLSWKSCDKGRGCNVVTSVLTVGARTLDYVSGTLRLKHSYDRRCTARFTVESDTDLLFGEAEEVDLQFDGVTVFGGQLFKPVETWPTHENREYKLEAVCYHHLPGTRIIAKSYVNTTVDVIVKDIITNILSDEGITEGSIPVGLTVKEVVFAYVNVAKALDKLAEVSDSHWHVNDDKELSFGPMSLFTAPFDLTDIEEFADDAEAETGNRDYRNKQYIRGGKSETIERTDSWIGDAEQTTFVAGFPLAKQPSITVDSVGETIAVRGIGDPNADWFWAAGSTEITQNTANPPVPIGDVIELTYVGLFDIIVLSTDEQEVVRRQQIQGFGSGVVEFVDTDTTIKTQGSAFQFAAGKLQRFAVEGRELKWSSELQVGLEPGQQILVNIPSRGFDNVTMFIPEIETKDRGGRVIKTIRAVEGPDDGDWATWFGRLLAPIDTIAFRENIGEEEILIILAAVEENWEWAEDVVVTVISCSAPSTTLFPSTTLLPC